jgi:DNA-directed RNA polymerase subunit M/transcription elongation factor TFIIS
MYIIARCPSCGKVMMANTANKTRSCPHCGRRHELSGLRTLARARTSREAVALIQSLKEQQGDAGWEPRFKRFRT